MPAAASRQEPPPFRKRRRLVQDSLAWLPIRPLYLFNIYFYFFCVSSAAWVSSARGTGAGVGSSGGQGAGGGRGITGRCFALHRTHVFIHIRQCSSESRELSTHTGDLILRLSLLTLPLFPIFLMALLQLLICLHLLCQLLTKESNLLLDV
ncbi:hypothetical protein PIB30_055653 [Stylosanthes scabra]|uniref:Uncharacterized protein n=1 Tax=Stylosanthes scabra TaxID=79078 RepID=A0ABU6VK47_9FABA|nr:hypothetical protein [Stylosanthes scabra]